MKAYLYYAKIKILVSLTYRFDVISSLLTNVVLVFASTYLWKVAYNGIGTVNDVNESQMITYSILALLLNTLFSINVENIINDRIREGDIAIDFMKPVNVFGIYLAQDIGSTVSSLVIRFLPLFLISSIFIQFPMPSSVGNFILFIISCLISFIILWLLSAIVGLLSFLVVDVGPIGGVKDALIKTLSGSIVPIWFFPENIRRIFECLPFIYIYQLPLSIYIGEIQTQEAIRSIMIQIIWAFVIYFLFFMMQKKVRGNLFVQGG